MPRENTRSAIPTATASPNTHANLSATPEHATGSTGQPPRRKKPVRSASLPLKLRAKDTRPAPSGQPRPYHGYLYRILTAQGKDAPGGPADYVINGKLIGGFAVVAWPAEYGNSGIMTFITNYSGDVYQKDLGEQTDKLARAMLEYDPDSSWKKAD